MATYYSKPDKKWPFDFGNDGFAPGVIVGWNYSTTSDILSYNIDWGEERSWGGTKPPYTERRHLNYAEAEAMYLMLKDWHERDI